MKKTIFKKKDFIIQAKDLIILPLTDNKKIIACYFAGNPYHYIFGVKPDNLLFFENIYPYKPLNLKKIILKEYKKFLQKPNNYSNIISLYDNYIYVYKKLITPNLKLAKNHAINMVYNWIILQFGHNLYRY